MTARWTLDVDTYSEALKLVAAAATEDEWCEQLETAPADALLGKVLCVCAAAAVARAVVTAVAGASPDDASGSVLELLDRWIDDPTDERFDQIATLFFVDGPGPTASSDIAWRALRTATSSVGNYEAGWALQSTCMAAREVGFSSARLRKIVTQELATRLPSPASSG